IGGGDIGGGGSRESRGGARRHAPRTRETELEQAAAPRLRFAGRDWCERTGQLLDRRRIEQRAKRNPGVQRRVRTRDRARGGERVAAEVEEVVAHADSRNVEDL